MLKAGLDVNHRDRRQETILSRAAGMSTFDLVEKLLEWLVFASKLVHAISSRDVRCIQGS
jgi:hypothetical protein